ncbi:MAG: DUF4272 domain-containing protein [Gemmata sp.]
MPREAINVFSRHTDLAGIVKLLRARAPEVSVDGPDDDWRRAVVTYGRVQSARTLVFLYRPDYCSEPYWSQQMDGMRAYLALFPEGPNKGRALHLPGTFKLVLATEFGPDFDAPGDPRVQLLFEVTKLLDGILFTPAALRDASGRILFGTGAEGPDDPDAVWPQQAAPAETAPVAPQVTAAPVTAPAQPAREGPDPPTAARVARRALALVAVTARAVLEQSDPTAAHVQTTYADLLAWARDLDLDAEFEPAERAAVSAPPGCLDSRQLTKATWRLEALAVLAWALKRADLPPHDELVQPNALWAALGILDVGAARDLLAAPALRPRAEVESLRARLFARHWRVRHFRESPGAMDFPAFARARAVGPLDLTGLPLVDGDLAVGGHRIDRAAPADLARARSTAHERCQAANWLCEGPGELSKASVAT